MSHCFFVFPVLSSSLSSLPLPPPIPKASQPTTPAPGLFLRTARYYRQFRFVPLLFHLTLFSSIPLPPCFGCAASSRQTVPHAIAFATHPGIGQLRFAKLQQRDFGRSNQIRNISVENIVLQLYLGVSPPASPSQAQRACRLISHTSRRSFVAGAHEAGK